MNPAGPGVLFLRRFQGENLTYQGHSTRAANRVLIALVVVTIAIVALWAMSGGLDEIRVSDDSGTVTVSG